MPTPQANPARFWNPWHGTITPEQNVLTSGSRHSATDDAEPILRFSKKKRMRDLRLEQLERTNGFLTEWLADAREAAKEGIEAVRKVLNETR